MRNCLIFAALLVVAACNDPGKPDVSTEPVSGETADTEQGVIAALLTTVNSDAGESWLTLHPNGRTAIFGRHVDGFGDQRIYMTAWDGRSWSTPAIAPFGIDVNERGARFSADGEIVYFASTRPTVEDDTDNDWNIWSVVGNAESWGVPKPLTEINSSNDDFHPSASANNEVFYGSRRSESTGESDMFVAREGPAGWIVEPLFDLNTEYSEPDPFIAPDGSYVIFARTNAPGGFGGDDLYISYASDGGWTEPQNLGSEVNTSEYEYGAFVTADGETLIYTTWASGTAQIAVIEVNALGLD
jgi:Tol biopolymer transport system component